MSGRFCPAVPRSLYLLVSLSLAAGCDQDSAIDGSSGPVFAGVELTVLVVGDETLAAALESQADQWKAETGGQFKVLSAPEAEAVTRAQGADVVLYPSYMLGPLVEHGRVVAVPERVTDDPELAWGQVFDLVRVHAVRWGRERYALPFGSVQLVLYYRGDLFEKFGFDPPATWEEYAERAAWFADRKNLGDAAPPDGEPWYGTVEPLAGNWAALSMLARAAGYAKHHDRYSTLFDISSLDPLVDGPAFRKATDNLVAAAYCGPSERTSIGPSEARQLFWSGQTAMAISWPSAAAKFEDVALSAKEASRASIAPLPLAEEVYHQEKKAWEIQPRRVPLLSTAGTLGSVTKSCAEEHQNAAFQLLVFLSSPESAARLGGASQQVTLCRRGLSEQAATAWVERPASGEFAAQYAAAMEETLSGQEYLTALRIPGRERYLESLSQGVRRVLAGQQTSRFALSEVARDWWQITKDIREARQHRAYQRSLELED